MPNENCPNGFGLLGSLLAACAFVLAVSLAGFGEENGVDENGVPKIDFCASSDGMDGIDVFKGEVLLGLTSFFISNAAIAGLEADALGVVDVTVGIALDLICCAGIAIENGVVFD